MSRLTKKSNSVLEAIEYQLIDEKENLTANEGVKKIQVLGTNKLGKLEDIEEELGIDLIKAIELCKKANKQKVVYTTERWGIDAIKIIDELDIEIIECYNSNYTIRQISSEVGKDTKTVQQRLNKIVNRIVEII